MHQLMVVSIAPKLRFNMQHSYMKWSDYHDLQAITCHDIRAGVHCDMKGVQHNVRGYTVYSLASHIVWLMRLGTA